MEKLGNPETMQMPLPLLASQRPSILLGQAQISRLVTHVLLLPSGCRKKFPKKGASQTFSKAARLKWQSLERRIFDIVMQRMTIVNLEADMERLIKVTVALGTERAGWWVRGRRIEWRQCKSPSLFPQKREELALLQEALLGKRAKLQAESPKEQKGLQELNEEIEVLGANIDYINDSISDCQATIMQIEETKVGGWTGPSWQRAGASLGGEVVHGHGQSRCPRVLL